MIGLDQQNPVNRKFTNYFVIFVQTKTYLMKNYILLSLLLFTATTSFAQKKGDLEIQIADQTKQIDLLNAQLDSTTSELKVYQEMHSVIADRVLKYDFEPEQMSSLIDSLRATRDSTFSASTEIWQDSVNVLMEHIRLMSTLPIDSTALDENTDLEAITSGTAALEAANSKPSKDDMMKELEMLKDLLDKGILTEDEFNERKKKVIANW